MKKKIVAVVLLCTNGIVMADAFSELASSDRPEGWDYEGYPFEQALEVAQSGDPHARALIAMGFYGAGEYQQAADLYRALYESNEFENIEPPTYIPFGNLLLKGEHGVKPDPVLGIKLLKHNAEHGYTGAQKSLYLVLRSSPLLPQSPDLAEAWRKMAGMERLANPEPEPEIPPDEQFGDCDNFLGKSGEVLAIFDRAQAKILESPQRANAIRKKAYDDILALDPGTHGDSSQELTLQFRHISASSLVKILIQASGEDLNFGTVEDEPGLGEVLLIAYSVPRNLIAARLSRALGFGFQCAPGWVGIVNSKARPGHEARKPFLAMNFLRSIEPAEEDEGIYEMHWFGNKDHGGTRYHGEIKNGRPHGRGELKIDGSTFQGDFVDGLPHGQGVHLHPRAIEYRGGFAMGHYHGEGFLEEVDPRTGKTQFRGRGEFEHGKFNGEGMKRLAAAKRGKYVTYRGPFNDGRPHGAGTCSAMDVSYSCQFESSSLVAVGDTRLEPKTTSGGDAGGSASRESAECTWEQAIRQMARFRAHGRASGGAGLNELAEDDRAGIKLLQGGEYTTACRWFEEAGARHGFDMDASPRFTGELAQGECTPEDALTILYILESVLDDVESSYGLELSEMRARWIAMKAQASEALKTKDRDQIIATCEVTRPLLASARDISHVASWFSDVDTWR